MTEWSLFISKANHSISRYPILCLKQYSWRSWSWMVLWRPTRPFRTKTQKRCLFHYRGLECQSRKSRNTWSNRQIWPWSTEWSSSVQLFSSIWLFATPWTAARQGLPVHPQLLEFTQIHVHWVRDAIQISHNLLFPSPLALDFSQHQDLFQGVSSLHRVANVLEF